MRKIGFICCLVLSGPTHAIDYCYPSHLLIGVNGYYRDYDEHLTRPLKSHEYGGLYGLNLSYEHKAPNQFFIQALLGFELGKTHYDGAIQNASGQFIRAYEGKTDNFFGHSQLLAGFTFNEANQPHLFTPILGIGTHFWSRGFNELTEEYFWGYLITGFTYEYNTRGAWLYGIGFKLMQMVSGQMDVSPWDAKVNLGNKLHVEISLPFVYQCPHRPNLEIHLTPYYRYQPIGESNLGICKMGGYALKEPASDTHVVGLNAALALGFK